MPDQEYTQIHFDCASVAATWLIRLHGDDVLKARAVLEELRSSDDDIANCVDLILCAIEDGKRASGEITTPRGITMCALLEAIEQEGQENLEWNEYAVKGASPAWLSIGQRVTVAFVELADENHEIDDASHPNALLRLRDFETGEVREIGVYTYEEARRLADLHGQNI